MEGAEITDCHAARQGCLGAMPMIVATVTADVALECHQLDNLRMNGIAVERVLRACRSDP